MTTALALAQDLQAGIVDRFRSPPMARSAFLAGHDSRRPLPGLAGLGFISGQILNVDGGLTTH
jgi:hypothetical protein